MSEKGNLRRFVVTLLVIAVSLPWLIQATRRSIDSMFNSPPLWVPQSLEYRRNYDWFRRVFAAHDTAILSFDGCTIDNPRLEDFSNALLSSDDPAEDRRRKRYFQTAIHGRDLLEQLRDLDVTPRAAAARLKGTFLGPDGKTTCVVVMITEQGVYARRDSLAMIRQTALEVFDIEPEELAVAGALVDGATIDAVSIKSIE